MQQGTIATLKEVKPNYVAIFSDEYADLARVEGPSGALQRVMSLRQPPAPVLYRLNADQLK
jgi:hypothetical protein